MNSSKCGYGDSRKVYASPWARANSLNRLKSHTEILQKADLLGVEVAAFYGVPFQPEALFVTEDAPIGPDEAVTMMPTYLSNRMRTIAGGSAEIQRNIVAKSILGL